jgi:hypothetical protein
VLTEICLVLFEFEAGEGDGVYIDESRCEIKLDVKRLCILQVFVQRPHQCYVAACQQDRISICNTTLTDITKEWSTTSGTRNCMCRTISQKIKL